MQQIDNEKFGKFITEIEDISSLHITDEKRQSRIFSLLHRLLLNSKNKTRRSGLISTPFSFIILLLRLMYGLCICDKRKY